MPETNTFHGAQDGAVLVNRPVANLCRRTPTDFGEKEGYLISSYLAAPLRQEAL
jgi:hypothetical protein